ncbi:DUF1214 domain-containing protein [Pseudomonas sp. PDM19]|uniref:DUF1214 domain-containing protein n=1 Tax=Pseudomonas sp. PDM19 TaxID=2769272 RepID=UPI001786260E|nr:DUF1214 domain-containing protein [Pseudomonas sp. PDM19]MBD9634654.1 DUF1254 domain-containing protein [Pseudomonas sp. PDM19]
MRIPHALSAVATGVLLSACATAGAGETPAAIADQDVSDAYVYLLGRALVLRQQQLDLQEGMGWNQLLHRKPGAVDWPNPNLDVAYSEAWLALDENSCTLLGVPKIQGRYYTVQVLNGWGETLANVNERTYAAHPAGPFAFCLKDAHVRLPAATQRIDLPVRSARLLTRVELGADPQQAERLQQAFTLKATGSPRLPEVPQTAPIAWPKLPGVELFDTASAALAEPDLNPGMTEVQAKVRAIAAVVGDAQQRQRIDALIHSRAFADIVKASPSIGGGTVRNGWARPPATGTYGSNYLTRTLVDYGGIWANTRNEVNYFRGALDADGVPLDGAKTYSLTFPKAQLPASQVHYFWSITATDSKTFHVLPNELNRFLLNNHSKLTYGADGSLTLYFGPQKPADAPEGNWLPTRPGLPYRLIFRYYGAQGAVADGSYFPPVLVKRS